MNVRFHRLAVAEIDHEVDYYESRQTGLGEELEDEIDAAIALIRRSSATRSSFSRWRTRASGRATGHDGGRAREATSPLGGRSPRPSASTRRVRRPVTEPIDAADLDGPAIVAVLTAHGIAAADIPAKLEGIAFGPDVVVAGRRQHTLWLANDNDFLATIVDDHHPTGIDNPNQFFVFAVDPASLPGLERRGMQSF